MPKCHIFNPENDLALAHGDPCYTAPLLARRLRADLSAFPIWWADEDDSVLVETKEDCNLWLESLPINLLCRNFASLKDLRRETALDITPWGWSHALCRWLERAVISEDRLPRELTVDYLRTLSHRNISIDIHTHLRSLVQDNLIPEECYTLSEVYNFIDTNGDTFIKSPWSSSGQGVFRVTNENFLAIFPRIERILEKQHSVMCERALEPILDFAVEFQSSGSGNVKFAGYSVFGNDATGSYDYGLVASTEILRSIIDSAHGDSHRLDDVIASLEEFLSKKVGSVRKGWLGVDMMVYRGEDGSPRLNPCIELNLRTTMGAAASVIGNRYLLPGKVGKMYVRYYKRRNQLDSTIASFAATPPIIENGMLAGGVLPLVPVTKSSQYLAYLEVD
ncbi:MAG: hypothetical protein ACI4BC_01960 [Muribaculaceae bacterium]